jgi:hypothetical protein
MHGVCQLEMNGSQQSEWEGPVKSLVLWGFADCKDLKNATIAPSPDIAHFFHSMMCR